MMAKIPNVRAVPFSSLAYNQAAARYISPSGQFIGPDAIRGIIETDLDSFKAQMRTSAESLRTVAHRYEAGAIGEQEYLQAVQVWRDAQAGHIKDIILGNVAAGAGGIHAMGQAEYGRAGQLCREQYTWLRDFVRDVAHNPSIVTGSAAGRMDFVERAASYGDAGLAAFEAQRLVAETEAGYGWEWNILDREAAHCQPHGGTESCPDQTAKGAVPIGELVPIGRRSCHGACRCQVKRFKSEVAAQAFLAGTSQ